MESQLTRPQQDYAQEHEVDPQGARLHTGIEGEQKQHDEKPAVLKKVKEKVKKIKNKIGIKKNDDGRERESGSSSEEEGMEVDDDGYKEDDEPNITSAPTSQPQRVSVGAEKVEPEKVQLGDAIGDIKEDPAAPRSANPPARGGEDIGITPLIREFESIAVSNKPKTEIEPNKHKTELETDEPMTKLKPDEPKTELGLDEPKTELESESKKEREPNESMTQLEPKPESQLSDAGSTGQPNASYTEKLKSMATVPTEYGKNIATTVYDKLSNAGTAVVQKIRGPTQSNSTETSSEVNQDKGVSVKEYISEKLKPGEEDAALSEVISEVVQKRKEDVGNATKEGMATAQTKTTSGGVGMVEKIRGAVTSVVGGGGRSGDTATAANDLPQEKVSQEDGDPRMLE